MAPPGAHRNAISLLLSNHGPGTASKFTQTKLLPSLSHSRSVPFLAVYACTHTLHVFACVACTLLRSSAYKNPVLCFPVTCHTSSYFHAPTAHHHFQRHSPPLSRHITKTIYRHHGRLSRSQNSTTPRHTHLRRPGHPLQKGERSFRIEFPTVHLATGKFHLISATRIRHTKSRNSHLTESINSLQTCRQGGEPHVGVMNCKGPCDLRAMNLGYVNHGSTSNPAAVYARGQRARLKYQRNNHGPGGFVRITLVRPEDMMDKSAHERNAFHYSCWGARPVASSPQDIQRDRYGFSVNGNDGAEHYFRKSFYETFVTIPPTVPDGDYLLGWVWFGGTGSKITSDGVQQPSPYGYFGDYWSCSYVRVQGGVPLQSSYTPVFLNDMKQFSVQGCMSANDSPGVCVYEPCSVTGKYQLPRAFKAGSPPPVTPAHFGGTVSASSQKAPSNPTPKRSVLVNKVPTKPPATHYVPKEKARRKPTPKKYKPKKKSQKPKKKRHGKKPKSRKRPSKNKRGGRIFPRQQACRCISLSKKCLWTVAKQTEVNCQGLTYYRFQPSPCKKACCQFCRGNSHLKVCRSAFVRTVCRRRT